MVADDFGYLGPPVARRLLQPLSQPQVESGPLRPGQAGVTGVAKQRVAELVRPAEQRIGERSGDQGPPGEDLDSRVRVRHAQGRQRIPGESPACHRGQPGRPAGMGGQVVELGRVDRMHRRWQRQVIGRRGQDPRAVALTNERSDADPGA